MDTRAEFRKRLWSLSDEKRSGNELKSLSDGLISAFLDYGSETPDNLDCARRIEYSWVAQRAYGAKRNECGLRLKGHKVLISDAIHFAGKGIEAVIQAEFPNLTPEECAAIVRITTMVLSCMEHSEG